MNMTIAVSRISIFINMVRNVGLLKVKWLMIGLDFLIIGNNGLSDFLRFLVFNDGFRWNNDKDE